MWHLGDTFWDTVGLFDDRHLIVVATNPSIYQKKGIEVVAIAPIMTYDGETNEQEDSCILDQSDGHKVIKHKSYVAYADSKFIPVSYLDKLEQSKIIITSERFNEETQYRILKGLSDSNTARNDVSLEALTQIEQLKSKKR